MKNTSGAKRARLRIGAFSAVVIASLVAAAGSWLLVLPAREPARLSPITPRPELLDKPHRHQAHAPSPEASAH